MKKSDRKSPKKINYVAYVATSIDGRISEGSLSKIDWTSREDWDFYQNSLKKFDAVVVGHNTYKMAEAQLKKRNAIVFTSQAGEAKSSGSVTFFNPRKSDFEKFIEGKNYKKVAILGGPRVYNFFLEQDLLDEMYVTVEPYVFTSGIPMFSGDAFKKYKFSLKSVKKLNKSGTILLRYKYES